MIFKLLQITTSVNGVVSSNIPWGLPNETRSRVNFLYNNSSFAQLQGVRHFSFPRMKFIYQIRKQKLRTWSYEWLNVIEEHTGIQRFPDISEINLWRLKPFVQTIQAIYLAINGRLFVWTATISTIKEHGNPLLRHLIKIWKRKFMSGPIWMWCLDPIRLKMFLQMWGG